MRNNIQRTNRLRIIWGLTIIGSLLLFLSFAQTAMGKASEDVSNGILNHVKVNNNALIIDSDHTNDTKTTIQHGSMVDDEFDTSWVSDDRFISKSVAVWGDMDGDGDLDILVGNYAQPNKLYQNDGSGIFTEVTTGDLDRDRDNTLSVAWGDMDGDGDLDILAGNEGQSNKLYQNDGSGVFTNVTTGDLDRDQDSTNSVAWGDMDGDGDLDILAGNDGQNKLYQNDGEGVFTDVTIGDLPVDSDITTGVAWGDMNGDGNLDILIGNNGQNKLYQNDGSGVFTDVTTGDLTIDLDDNMSSVAWGDMDGDSDLDILIGLWGHENKLYRNDGNGVFTDVTPESFIIRARYTTSVAWEDMDGDGDLDILVGNYGQNKLYQNDGEGVFTDVTVGDLYADPDDTRSVAWGDMDGDDDLDVLVGNHGQTKVYQNAYSSLPITTTTPPLPIVINPPDSAGDNNDDGMGDIVSSPIISVPLTVNNAETSPSTIRFEYSPTGGAKWFPAIAANGEDRIQVANGENTFLWDTFASGFFAQSDNVILRATLIQQTSDTFSYPNETAGSFLYGAFSSVTTPFHVRGTQVRVIDEVSGVKNAIVYRTSPGDPLFMPIGNDNPFRTSDSGFLENRFLELTIGDQLIALFPMTSTTKYTLYYVSETVSETGFTNPYAFTSGGVQTLTVSSENPLLVFDLNVSLEWDAREDETYRDQLQDDIEYASERLYDLSNGQVALGDVTVYFDKQNWLTSDIRIHASNAMRPSADMGGIVVTPTVATIISGTQTIEVENGYLPGQIEMPAEWNRFGTPGKIGHDWANTLAHELSHFLLYLPDNYLGLSEEGLLIDTDCKGSVMTDLYREDYSEYLSVYEWTGECEQTVAAHSTGLSDWETIKRFYPYLDDSRNIEGPNKLELALTKITFVEPAYTPTTIDESFAYLEDEDGTRASVNQGQAYLIKTEGTTRLTDDSISVLGSSDRNRIQLRGAELGDRVCIFGFDNMDRQLGCTTINEGTPRVTIQSADNWFPQVALSPVTSHTIAITVTNVTITNTNSLHVQLYPAPLFTNTESITAPITMLTDLGNDVYAGTLTLSQPIFEGYIRLWDEESNREDISSFFFGGGWGPLEYEWGSNRYAWGAGLEGWNAPVIGASGQVMLFNIDYMYGDSPPYTLQSSPVAPDLPSWIVQVGDAQQVTLYGTVTPTGKTSIQFNYRQRHVPDSRDRVENQIAVYYSADEGGTWERLETNMDIGRNFAAAQIVGNGMYVLGSTIAMKQLQSGWNNVPFPVEATRPITESLASIEGSFTSVYWHDDTESGRWLLYDSTIVPPFESSINTLEEMTLDAYWIYMTEPITWYVGVETGSQRRSRKTATVPTPPATYYGWVTSVDEIELESAIEAWVDGVICGQTTIVEIENKPAYVIQVEGEHVLEPNGCGRVGREIEFVVNGIVIETRAWNNYQANFWPLTILPGVTGPNSLLAVTLIDSNVYSNFVPLFWLIISSGCVTIVAAHRRYN